MTKETRQQFPSASLPRRSLLSSPMCFPKLRSFDLSVYQPQCPVPARDLKEVGYRVGKVMKPPTKAGGNIPVPIPHRPVDDERSSNNIFPGYKAPVTAVLTVIPIIAHDKIMAFGNNQLAVFH